MSSAFRCFSSFTPGSCSTFRIICSTPTIRFPPIRWTPAHVVPEWYLLPFYAMLRAIPSKLWGVIIMASAILVLAFIPWLDRSPVKSAKYRPSYRVFFWVFIAICIGLGYLGSQEPTEGLAIIARILTFGYFAFFLIIMPVLSFTEKTKPIPLSIADAVLTRTKTAVAAAE